jgi:hypothetical protein
MAAGGDMTVSTPVTPSAPAHDAKPFNARDAYISHEARDPVTGVLIVTCLLKKALGVINLVINGVIRFVEGGFREVLS